MQQNSNPYSAEQYPDLSLAQTPPAPNVANGQQVANMPTSMPPIPREQPSLQPGTEDISKMGIVDNVPYFDLNLAAATTNLSNPPFSTPSDGNMINGPTFTSPNFSVPGNMPFDFQAPGIDTPPPLAPDPQIGDLLQFDKPHGLDITAASSNPMAIDPMAPDTGDYDRPSDLAIPGPLMVDPALPDLQSPVTTQEVNSMLDDRPGELDDSALQIMHAQPTYTQIPAANYEALWMSQLGNNSRRERHQGMLMLGLDREEGSGDA
jgi:hypothetical protein